MEDQHMYHILYQSSLKEGEGIRIKNIDTTFYRDELMPRQKFIGLTRKLFAQYENDFDAVMDALVRNHGFRYTPNTIVAVQADLEGNVSIR